jgi:hypothetical protein
VRVRKDGEERVKYSGDGQLMLCSQEVCSHLILNCRFYGFGMLGLK